MSTRHVYTCPFQRLWKMMQMLPDVGLRGAEHSELRYPNSFAPRKQHDALYQSTGRHLYQISEAHRKLHSELMPFNSPDRFGIKCVLARHATLHHAIRRQNECEPAVR